MYIDVKHILRILLLVCPMALAGCMSFTSNSTPHQPESTTVVVPPGSTTTVVCANGAPPPCN